MTVKYTAAQKKKVADLASLNCQTGTIANITGIPYNSLKRHFGNILTKKRAEYKAWLRKTQKELAPKNPAMAIFLGKNVLDQTDKQEVTHDIPDDLKGHLDKLFPIKNI